MALTLTTSQQAASMEARWPQFKMLKLRGHRVDWVGLIQPTPANKCYEVNVTYFLRKMPLVSVPGLVSRPGEPIPHMYRQENLCLYYPKDYEWHPGCFLSETTIHWASLWLYHYEAWLVTGAWDGGGVVHGTVERERRRK